MRTNPSASSNLALSANTENRGPTAAVFCYVTVLIAKASLVALGDTGAVYVHRF